MNRKDFLQKSVPLLATAYGLSRATSSASSSCIIPPYLKPGSTIGITCPSGFITIEDLTPCINKLEQWGFRVIVGNTVGARDFTFGGADEERVRDLQRMLDENYIEAVLLGRGGYGAIRIIDKIDFTKFRKNPKWIIGFSDATALHVHLNSVFHIATIHSKMCNSFPADEGSMVAGQADSIDSIRRVLLGEKMVYEAPTVQENRPGVCEGKLVGGNLSIIQMLCGSRSQIRTDQSILYLEDVGEYLYKLDGMMWNLRRSGKLDNLKGLVIGAFRVKPDDPDEQFGLNLHQIVMEKVKEFSYPVCFDFPVGHVAVNYALKSGAPHLLNVTSQHAVLTSLQ